MGSKLLAGHLATNMATSDDDTDYLEDVNFQLTDLNEFISYQFNKILLTK